MGTELVGPFVKEDNMEIPSIPPGFESLVPFTLKRTQDNQVSSYSGSASSSGAQNIQLETEYDCNGNSKPIKSRRRRACVKYTESDSSSGAESDTAQNIILRNQLPKGVIRGCEACKNCQKVTAKWHPEEARRPDLEEAPVFYPSEEEFEDTLKYISSIRSKAELYGICRIVPPPSWKPPCPLKEKSIWERSKFTTRVQRIDKLQNRVSMRKILKDNDDKRSKKRRCMKNDVGHGNGIQEIKIPDEVGLYVAERFGFEPGPDFTLDAFQKYADDFVAQYLRKNNSSYNSEGNSSMPEDQWQPSVEDIEGEYWRMVEKPTEEIEVLYGADLETGAFGSGFPKSSQRVASAADIKYINSGWNLNNFPRLPGSVLSFESSNISGVVVPWLYVGMCFSSFCWHVEDHYLYSLNYMHWGAPKMWYGVPGSDALKLEAAMKKHLPDLFEEQPDLLHKLVTQLSPSILKSEGVPVYRCVQNPGEFVVTFPRAYHAGFNCGFNCAEAVNVAPFDWLPHGQNAIEIYRQQGRQTSISHDKLLLGAAREAVKENWEYNLLRKSNSNNLRWKEVCGEDGILSKALKTRVEMERVRRDFLCKSSQALKMSSSFDANSERECSVCLFDLHLSAAGCHNCSPAKYACLNHARQLCSCSWGAKFFLFRYDVDELNVLVEALEGKLSAVYRWARLDLGLALSSHGSKDNKQTPVPEGKLSHTSQGVAPKEIHSLADVVSSKKQKKQVDRNILNSMKYIDSTQSFQNVNPRMVVLALECVKASSNLHSKKVDPAKHSFPCKNENSLQAAPNNKTPSCQVSQANSLKIKYSKKTALEKSEGKQSLCHENKDILLSDEGDEPGSRATVEKGTRQRYTSSIQKPVCLDNTASLSHNSPASTITVTSHVMLEEKEGGSKSECIKVEGHAEADRYVESNTLNSSSFKLSLTTTDSNKDVPGNSKNPECDESNADRSPKQRIDYEKSNSQGGREKLELDVESRSLGSILTTSSSSGHQNNMDRYHRQKGPRIAKVVRRINCSIEPLDFGSVCAGKLWCDSRAIYPKGFRSRVRYIDVIDPTKMSYYVSEVLDAGRDGPLFMVSLEQNPSEVFSHVSAARCWEMVRERVNHEIAKRHKLGREKLPPLQPPGCLDGIEMFGFSSPEIVQAIQAMDQNRVCNEYWKSRPLMQIPQSGNSNLKSEPLNDQETCKSQPPVETILNGLFKKANSEELHTLYSLLYNKNSNDDQSLLTRLLNEEINKYQGK